MILYDVRESFPKDYKLTKALFISRDFLYHLWKVSIVDENYLSNYWIINFSFYTWFYIFIDLPTYLHNSNQWKLEYYSALKKYSFIYNMNWWSISIIMCPKQPRLNVEHYHYMLGNLLICQLCLSNKARIFALANKNLSEVSNTGYWKVFFFFTKVEKQIKKGNEWRLYLFLD